MSYIKEKSQRLLFYSLLIVTTLSIGACNELNKQLDLVPISAESGATFYSNETEINQAIIAGYQTLANILVNSDYSYWMTESRSDNTWFTLQGVQDVPINEFEVTPTLPILSTCWGDHYSLIFQANKILAALAKVKLPDSIRNQFEGEAKFLRGFAYFNLVRYFGAVPIITSPISISQSQELSRDSIQEVYNQIVSDFKDASELLPESYPPENFGRATKWVAEGLLGKVYLFESGYPLYLNKWDEAIPLFTDIINSGEFSFFSNYSDIFSFSNELGNQSLFSIRFVSGQNDGNSLPERWAPGIPLGSTDVGLAPSQDLINSFEPGDVREDDVIQFTWTDRNGNLVTNSPFVKLYLNGPHATSSDWDIDWIVLRYTEILMMYAEALNETSGPEGVPLSILNMVRARAGLAPRPSTNNKDTFRLWLTEERRHEFCFENKRWFYLVRTDQALSVMKNFLSHYNLQANFTGRDKYVYPIPQTEIDLDPNLTQNPGY